MTAAILVYHSGQPFSCPLSTLSQNPVALFINQYIPQKTSRCFRLRAGKLFLIQTRNHDCSDESLDSSLPRQRQSVVRLMPSCLAEAARFPPWAATIRCTTSPVCAPKNRTNFAEDIVHIRSLSIEISYPLDHGDTDRNANEADS